MIEANGQYQYHKLDRWEDLQRRRNRLVKNRYGTSHPQATLRPGSAEGKFILSIFNYAVLSFDYKKVMNIF